MRTLVMQDNYFRLPTTIECLTSFVLQAADDSRCRQIACRQSPKHELWHGEMNGTDDVRRQVIGWRPTVENDDTATSVVGTIRTASGDGDSRRRRLLMLQLMMLETRRRGRQIGRRNLFTPLFRVVVEVRRGRRKTRRRLVDVFRDSGCSSAGVVGGQ